MFSSQTADNHYTLYGLHTLTDRPLPGLRPEPSLPTIDVHLWFDAPPPIAEDVTWQPHQRFASHRGVDQGDEAWLTVLETADGAYARLKYSDGVHFTLDRAATQIWCSWPEQFTFEYVVSYITNPVMGFCLRLRDQSCLHASAVMLDDGVVLFSAPSGHGKSTTASYFALRGHAVFADDIAVLKPHPNGVMVEPGYPHLRLWDESARALLGAAELLPTIAPDWEKRYIDLQQHGLSYATHPVSVKGICLLKPRLDVATYGDQPVRLERVSPIRALGILMDNMYMNYLLDQRLRTCDFAVLGRLVGMVPVYFVTASDKLDGLPELYTAIVNTFNVG